MTTLYDVYTATDKVRQVKLKYKKNHSIKSQILFTYGHVNLLNVSKTYVDHNYLGISLLFMINKDFLKVFRDVNTGYSEEVVDNLNQLIKFQHFLLRAKSRKGETPPFPFLKRYGRSTDWIAAN